LAAHFAKRNTKFGGGGKARAGKNSFPPTPFFFARPSDWISEFAVRIFVKKSSDFVQKVPPIGILQERKLNLVTRSVLLAYNLEGLFWRKGFINKSKRNFFIRFFL